MAAPIWVKAGSRATKNGGGPSTLTPTINCTIGNRLVADFEFNVFSGTTAIATPPGWNLVHSLAPTGSQTYKPQLARFEKVAASTTESCPITTVGTDTYGGGQIEEWSGVTAVDTAASTTANNADGAATSASITAAAALAVADSAVTVHCTAETGGGGTTSFSSPASSGYTVISTSPNDSSLIAYDISRKTVAVTTAPTAGYTWSGGSRYQIGITILSGSAGAGDVTVTPGVGQSVFAGFAPTAVATQNQTVVPGVGSATFAGFAPTAIAQDLRVVTPGVGQAQFNGFAPAAVSSANQVVQPGAGSAVFAGQAPTALVSDNKSVTPGAGVALFTGLSPIAQNGSSQVVQPGTGALLFDGKAPVAVSTQNQFVSPGTGQAVFNGLEPVANNGAAATKVQIPAGGLLPIFNVIDK